MVNRLPDDYNDNYQGNPPRISPALSKPPKYIDSNLKNIKLVERYKLALQIIANKTTNNLSGEPLTKVGQSMAYKECADIAREALKEQ